MNYLKAQKKRVKITLSNTKSGNWGKNCFHVVLQKRSRGAGECQGHVITSGNYT